MYFFVFCYAGNSSYGAMLMNRTKHSDVTFTYNKHDALLKVNSPMFKKIEVLDEQFYEIETFKKKVCHTECVHIGILTASNIILKNPSLI